MDFEPGPLLASLLVSSVGLVLVMYGKRQKRIPQIAIGVLLLVFPYFLSSAWLILLIGALLCGLLWFALRFGW